MTEPAAPLKSVQWFPTPPRPRPSGVGSALIKLGVGGAVGALLFVSHHATAAYVVWGIAGAVGAVSIASAGARAAIDRALAAFGRGVGTVLGAVLLTMVYVLVVTPTRFVRRALGADDLHLRDAGRPSYWLPCDDDARKVRWVGTMFATEPATSGGGHPLRNALVALVALVLLAEGVLRTKGFGHPLLYVADPEIGYYPQPNADLNRYGGRVATNKFGMRSPEVDRHKPAGTFRILMMGDSTLFGGSYIDQEDVYSAQVQKRLDARPRPGKVEVLAMGCNGWGPFHERGFVHRHPDVFQADLVMVHLPIDDVVRPLYGLVDVPFFAVQTPPRFAIEESANSLMWRYRENHAGKDDAWEARQARIGIREFGRLADDVLAAGAEMMFFVLPSAPEGMATPIPEGAHQQRITRWLQHNAAWQRDLTAEIDKRGVKTYHARDHFKGRGTEEEIYRDDWVHLNPKGHHVYAEYIEAKVVSESLRYRAWTEGTAPPPRSPAPAGQETRPAVEKP